MLIALGTLAALESGAAPGVSDLSALPTIVDVTVHEDRAGRPQVRSGVGFAFEKDGFILSTYQILLDESSNNVSSHVDVYVHEHGKWYPADIVGVEPTLNLSILKIDPEGNLTESTVKPYGEIEEGVEIFAPVFRASTADTQRTLHIQAGRLRVLPRRECYQKNMTSTMIQGSLKLGAGEIGTPIVNESGEVIAIFTGYEPAAGADPDWDGASTMFLPAYLAMNIYDSLKTKKSMRSPWTGFSVRRLNETERALFPTAEGEEGGIAIEDVWEKSPAESLGIREGDLLVKFGYYPIQSPADFQKWLYMYGVGHTVKLTLLRDGEHLTKEYRIEERPDWAIPE
jgi:S1-C subfamily serine protease